MGKGRVFRQGAPRRKWPSGPSNAYTLNPSLTKINYTN